MSELSCERNVIFKPFFFVFFPALRAEYLWR